jgi:hypothetical protein
MILICRKFNNFMDLTVPIKVESKGVENLISGETNVWDYPFFLNVEPNGLWIALFRKHFSLPQNAAPIFSGNAMVLSCIPANLTNRYQAVKQAIEKANLEYVEVIKFSRESKEKEQAKQRLAEEQKEKSAEQTRREFDELEL